MDIPWARNHLARSAPWMAALRPTIQVYHRAMFKNASMTRRGPRRRLFRRFLATPRLARQRDDARAHGMSIALVFWQPISPSAARRLIGLRHSVEDAFDSARRRRLSGARPRYTPPCLGSWPAKSVVALFRQVMPSPQKTNGAAGHRLRCSSAAAPASGPGSHRPSSFLAPAEPVPPTMRGVHVLLEIADGLGSSSPCPASRPSARGLGTAPTIARGLHG